VLKELSSVRSQHSLFTGSLLSLWLIVINISWILIRIYLVDQVVVLVIMTFLYLVAQDANRVTIRWLMEDVCVQKGNSIMGQFVRHVKLAVQLVII
jgi:hypothetical protein